MEGTPLLDVMRGLILEPEAQADFAADPSGYMQRFGYDDVPEDDLREAVGLVADTLPPDVAHAVNTAAEAESGDEDTFGDGTVGLLGRISTAEVTESVVPDLDDLPPDDAGGFDDDLASDHDTTTFGEITRDFDDDAEDHGDAGAGDGDVDSDAAVDVDDVDVDDVDAHDDGGHDVSFGDAGFDETDLGDTPGGDSFDHDAGEGDGDSGPEAFGQGSGLLDAADDGISDAPDVSDGADAAIEPDDSFDDTGFDDPGFDDPAPDGGFDDGFGLDDATGDAEADVSDDPDLDRPDDADIDGDVDGDVGQF